MGLYLHETVELVEAVLIVPLKNVEVDSGYFNNVCPMTSIKLDNTPITNFMLSLWNVFLQAEKKKDRERAKEEHKATQGSPWDKVLCSFLSNQAATLQRIPRWSNRSEYVV